MKRIRLSLAAGSQTPLNDAIELAFGATIARQCTAPRFAPRRGARSYGGRDHPGSFFAACRSRKACSSAVRRSCKTYSYHSPGLYEYAVHLASPPKPRRTIWHRGPAIYSGSRATSPADVAIRDAPPTSVPLERYIAGLSRSRADLSTPPARATLLPVMRARFAPVGEHQRLQRPRSHWFSFAPRFVSYEPGSSALSNDEAAQAAAIDRRDVGAGFGS